LGRLLCAAKVALALTFLLAATLIASAVFHTAWLGFVAMALPFGALIAREVTVWGGRGFLIITGAFGVVVVVAFLAAQLG
jgi:hypothetical protein